MNNIKKYRELADMTRSELAKRIGCSVGAIGHYELGRRTPTLNMCWKITSIFMQMGICETLDEVFPLSNWVAHHASEPKHTDGVGHA